MSQMFRFVAFALVGMLTFGSASVAALASVENAQLSRSDRSIKPIQPSAQPPQAPTMGNAVDVTPKRLSHDLWRVVSLRDYNTRVVLIGTTLLGAASGLVGSFTLLRKRALMGDALSHATLPGIAIAFMIGVSLGGDGKWSPGLLIGATISGVIGVLTILFLRRNTKLKEDTALGIVLSVFFGAGIALMRLGQQMDGGYAAGLESFILGKTASMRAADAILIAWAAGLACLVCLLFFKELCLLCFDDAYAGSRGYPVLFLDLALMACVVTVSIVGLQAVGLVLMIALLIIPAAAARFWTQSLALMLGIAAFIGGTGAAAGSILSALWPDLPSGAMIVIACATMFAASLIFGSKRGLVRRLRLSQDVERTVDRQHLLRDLFEIGEATGLIKPSTEKLLEHRSWSVFRLNQTIRQAATRGLVTLTSSGVKLTRKGRVEARRLTREHRLWELYLISHADIAPARVDRAADRIEHVLEPEVIAELESLLDQESAVVPTSPHAATAGQASQENPR